MRFGEPHPFPVSGSPTGLSASGQQSYEGWSCRNRKSQISVHLDVWANWQQKARTYAIKERSRGPHSTTGRTMRAEAAFANCVHSIKYTQWFRR